MLPHVQSPCAAGAGGNSHWGRRSTQNFGASTLVEKLDSHFSELLCCLLLTVIYGINNNSLADVEGPGEESGCGHGGIASLLGKKKKVVNYFPK